MSQCTSLAKFADLNDGELFIGKFGGRTHTMIKAYVIENDDRLEWALILSPTHKPYNNKPGFVEPSALETTLVVRLKDFELCASLAPEDVTLERGYSHDVGAIFMFEKGIALCARALHFESQGVLTDIGTGKIIEHSEPFPNAKIASWQIRRRTRDGFETIVEYP